MCSSSCLFYLSFKIINILFSVPRINVASLNPLAVFTMMHRYQLLGKNLQQAYCGISNIEYNPLFQLFKYRFHFISKLLIKSSKRRKKLNALHNLTPNALKLFQVESCKEFCKKRNNKSFVSSYPFLQSTLGMFTTEFVLYKRCKVLQFYLPVDKSLQRTLNC